MNKWGLFLNMENDTIVFPETPRPTINMPGLLYHPYTRQRYNVAKQLAQTPASPATQCCLQTTSASSPPKLLSRPKPDDGD